MEPSSWEVKVNVKNTFLDVEVNDEDSVRSSLYRGSQSCSARLSEPSPGLFPEDSDGLPEEQVAFLAPSFPAPATSEEEEQTTLPPQDAPTFGRHFMMAMA